MPGHALTGGWNAVYMNQNRFGAESNVMRWDTRRLASTAQRKGGYWRSNQVEVPKRIIGESERDIVEECVLSLQWHPKR